MDKLFSERLTSEEHTNKRFEIDSASVLQCEEDFLTLTARNNIDFINLGDFMRLVYQEFLKTLEKKPVEEKDQNTGRMTKADLVKRLITFLNRCLRLMRAYNFDATIVD